MTFRLAAEAAPAVAHHIKPGLQALRHEHRGQIKISDPRRLEGSIDIDHALRSVKPHDPRWDYGVGLRQPTQAVWIEVHPASSLHVEPVLEKLRWLQKWLKTEAPELEQLRALFIWLATGSVALPATSPKRRLLAASGLLFKTHFVDLNKPSR